MSMQPPAAPHRVAIANIDMAEWIYSGASVWWAAGAAGAVMSAFWNYAMSTLFVWRAR